MFWSSREEARKWVQEALPYVDVAVGNLDECEIAVGEREPYAAARALHERGVAAGDRQAGPEGRPRRTTARRTSRCRRCRSTWSTASAPATRSAGRCATACSLDGISSGACGSATRPVRSSRGAWRAPTRCRLRTRSRPSCQRAGGRTWMTTASATWSPPASASPGRDRRGRGDAPPPHLAAGRPRPADDDRRGPPGPRRARRRQPPVRHGRPGRPARPARAGAVPAGRERRARHPGHPRGPAAARRAGRQGRHRLDEPRRPGRARCSSWTTGSPATTRRPSRTPASRAARCSPASTRTTRPPSRRSSRARTRSATSPGTG